jgi:hypothetical protein
LTLNLKFIRETELAREYENSKGRRQWIPKSVCKKTLKWTNGIHEVEIEDWWLQKNPFEKPDAPQQNLL